MPIANANAVLCSVLYYIRTQISWLYKNRYMAYNSRYDKWQCVPDTAMKQ